VIETGPTGALALHDEVDYKFSDFADQVKSVSQVAATKVQTLASEVKEKAAGSVSGTGGNSTASKGAPDMLKRARELIGSGKRDDAIGILRDIVAFFPESPEAATAKSSLQKAGIKVD
jgi:hypothetical protein